MISPQQMFSIVAAACLWAAALFLLTGCAATFPIGEAGKFGSIKVGYYPPDTLFGLAVPRTLNDK